MAQQENKSISYEQYLNKLLLVNSDNYLMSFEEASKKLRISRDKFISDYVKSGKIKVTLLEDGKMKISNADLNEYLFNQKKIYGEV